MHIASLILELQKIEKSNPNIEVLVVTENDSSKYEFYAGEPSLTIQNNGVDFPSDWHMPTVYLKL